MVFPQNKTQSLSPNYNDSAGLASITWFLTSLFLSSSASLNKPMYSCLRAFARLRPLPGLPLPQSSLAAPHPPKSLFTSPLHAQMAQVKLTPSCSILYHASQWNTFFANVCCCLIHSDVHFLAAATLPDLVTTTFTACTRPWHRLGAQQILLSEDRVGSDTQEWGVASSHQREATAVCKKNEVSVGARTAAAWGSGGEEGLPGPARYLLRS